MLPIRPRLRITPLLSVGLALAFGAAGFGLICADLWMESTRVPNPGKTAPITYRVPEAGFYEDFREQPTHHLGAFQVNRGTRFSIELPTPRSK